MESERPAHLVPTQYGFLLVKDTSLHRGYVKLWRRALDAGWLKNHKLWVFWCYCIMKASHKNIHSVIGFQDIEILPGQFIYGRKKASEETGLSERETRTCLQSLIKMQNVTIKTTNKFSIITIINWDSYQAQDEDNDQQNDQQLTNNRPTTDQQLTTYKNEKNEKKRNIFIVPSFDEVQAYCLSRNNGINPQAFIDYYAARGWMLGKSKMKDWKAAVRTWESRNNVSEKKEAWEI